MRPALPINSASRRNRTISGFTLAEVVIAGCLLAVLITGSLVALTQINRWATSARLRTLGLAVAQQRIDILQTTPWQALGARPTVLAAGTATESSVPLNNDTFNSAAGLNSAFTNLDTQMTAVRTTQITDLTTRTLRAVVTVTFTYRNRPHSVSLTTLRATDSI